MSCVYVTLFIVAKSTFPSLGYNRITSNNVKQVEVCKPSFKLISSDFG